MENYRVESAEDEAGWLIVLVCKATHRIAGGRGWPRTAFYGSVATDEMQEIVTCVPVYSGSDLKNKLHSERKKTKKESKEGDDESEQCLVASDV